MISIEVTLRIALEAHAGQKDLDGNPAILHPLAVGLMGKTEAEIKAGFLHDVVEDSSITLESLKNRGVEDEELTALALLSHNKEKVGYFEYVENIIASGNVTAIQSNLMTCTTICNEARSLMKRPSPPMIRPSLKNLTA